MVGEQIVFVKEDGTPTGEVGPKLESHHVQTRLHLAFSCYIFNKRGEFLVTQRALGKKVWPGVWTNSVCGHPAPRPMHRVFETSGKAKSLQNPLGDKSSFSLRSDSQRTGSTSRADAHEETQFFAQVQEPWQVESFEAAIQRRLGEELGMQAKDFQAILPNYRYTTPPYKGIIENEFCPVFVARAASEPDPNPEEVANCKWIPWEDFVSAAEADSNDYSMYANPEVDVSRINGPTYSWWCKDQLRQLAGHPLTKLYSQPIS